MYVPAHSLGPGRTRLDFGLHPAALSWVLCSQWTCTSLWLSLALAVLSSVGHTPLGLAWVLGVEQHPCRGCEAQSPSFVVICYMVC